METYVVLFNSGFDELCLHVGHFAENIFCKSFCLNWLRFMFFCEWMQAEQNSYVSLLLQKMCTFPLQIISAKGSACPSESTLKATIPGYFFCSPAYCPSFLAHFYVMCLSHPQTPIFLPTLRLCSQKLLMDYVSQRVCNWLQSWTSTPTSLPTEGCWKRHGIKGGHGQNGCTLEKVCFGHCLFKESWWNHPFQVYKQE